VTETGSRRSGNPAKRAHLHTLDEARAAVREGKSFKVKPFPSTEVIIKSSNPQDAVEVIKALQPAPEEFDGEQLDAIFHQVEIMLSLLGGNSEYNNLIGEWLRRIQDRYEFNARYAE